MTMPACQLYFPVVGLGVIELLESLKDVYAGLRAGRNARQAASV